MWDRLDDDLVERVVTGDSTACITLGLHWVVRPGENLAFALRLAEDAPGEILLLTTGEAETRAREVAERRVAELEAELRRRQS